MPILRADHALRGIVVPKGKGILRFTFQPTSLYQGLVLFALAVAVLAGLRAAELWQRPRVQKA